MVGFLIELLTTIIYNIYIMQMGSKLGTLHSPPPWSNTVLGVPLHIYNTYTIAHQNFKIANLSHVQSFMLNVQDEAPRLPWNFPGGSQLPANPEV